MIAVAGVWQGIWHGFLRHCLIRYYESSYISELKAFRMDFIVESCESLERAFERYEQFQKENTSGIEKERYYFDVQSSEERLKIRHILQHFDNTQIPFSKAAMPPVLLSVQAFQYEGIDDGIFSLMLTYFEEGVSVEGLNVIFSDKTIFLKDVELYAAAKLHSEYPFSLPEIMTEFGLQRYVRFLLYTEDHKDRIEAFLSPRMRVPDWQDCFVAKISKQEMEEIMRSRVSANLTLFGNTRSNTVPLRVAPFRVPIPGYVVLQD